MKTKSAEETFACGAAFGKEILKTVPRNATVLILLRGNLGAGKTVWAGGFINGYLGKKTVVTSPSYSLINRYARQRRRVHHADLYRLTGPDDLESVGFWDLLAEPGVLLVEWGEQLSLDDNFKGAEVWSVTLEMEAEDPQNRKIEISRLFERE